MAFVITKADAISQLTKLVVFAQENLDSAETPYEKEKWGLWLKAYQKALKELKND